MPDVVGELPREAGAYVLLIRLEGRLPLYIPAFRGKASRPACMPIVVAHTGPAESARGCPAICEMTSPCNGMWTG